MSDYTLLNEVISALNGYSIQGRVLQCYFQPQPPGPYYKAIPYQPAYQMYSSLPGSQSDDIAGSAGSGGSGGSFGSYGYYGSYGSYNSFSSGSSDNSASWENDSTYTSANHNRRHRRHNHQYSPSYRRMAPLPYSGYLFNGSYGYTPYIPDYGGYPGYMPVTCGGDDADYDEKVSQIDDTILSTVELAVFNPKRHVDPTRLFIGNVPFSSTFENLWSSFQEHGEKKLKSLEMQRQLNGMFKGFAIGITGSHDESVELIKTFNGKEFEGRDLIVRFDKLPKQIMRSHGRRRLLLTQG
ncbi:hypothetical protein FOA43_002618 [Brettanomyces nanus]|uniref:RRM domain-containing protein n=1 Tax=Eeniella nana TaxID=13502 RepID=A0A875S2T8_EENNA|nr:uncharacterized protein FOA43_002618 [Brettanomyces nanus]QPG75268.1 hypothetical protein FOA43_002618 [Brettanomyces nanus]